MLAAVAAAVSAVAFLGPSTQVSGQPEPTPQNDRVELVIFHGDGCPHCARALDFLDELQDREPMLDIVRYEVWYDKSNLALFESVAAIHGIDALSVPTIFLGNLHWVGFDSTVADQIENAVEALIEGRVPEEPSRTSVDVPFVGAVDVGDRSLIVATVLIAFVDGVNPCSFWVLSMLLTLVLHSGSRRRTFAVGSVFLVVTSCLYGLYMFGAYSALDYAEDLSWIRLTVALVAGTFGVLHLKEYITHRGLSLTIPDAKKPGMYKHMRSLARPERSLPAILGGTVVLATGVSLAETPCTAGLPLLWTDLLSSRDVSGAGTALLFGIYLLVFLLDELALFAIAVVALRSVRMQERHGRALQLLSGTLMVALALTMIVAPQLLESVTGTSAVFVAAGLVVAAVLAIDRTRAGRQPAVTAPRRPRQGR